MDIDKRSSQPDEVPSTISTPNVKIEEGESNQKEDEKKYDCSSSSSTTSEDGEKSQDEDFYKPPEPDYSRANSLLFYTLTKRMEALWEQRKKSASSDRNIKKASKEDLLAHLLPKTLWIFLKGGSPFPFLRLMIPDKDNIRPHCGMKEKMIASVWGDAIGLNKNSPDFLKLTNYNDPIFAGPTACGDLSLAIFEVVQKRHPSISSSCDSKKYSSKITIGQINTMLDELATMKQKQHSTTSSGSSYRTLRQMRARWVEKLIAKNISPLEHKWIVRILLQKLEMGIGSESLLNYYHPWATDIYNANKNIRTLCATLSDPEYVRQKKEQLQKEVDAVENHNRMHHLPQSREPATLNSTIAPMLSMRTSFESFLSDIQKRHQAYVDALDKDDPLRQSLTLKFPSFVSEVKLDGERILAHVKRGIVKMQTRNSVWYSDLYSPVLGPPIRNAISKYDIDVILDGEVISWDNKRKETIPFGNNRTVAKCRREWCQQHGHIDVRDLGLHGDETEGLNAMSTAASAIFEKPLYLEKGTQSPEDGRDCWLKFVVFDILYIGGPDAKKAIKESCGFFSRTKIPATPGSILNAHLCARKCILHAILRPQENIVEIVESHVVRSDGTCVDGVDYFTRSQSLEFGYHPAVLDSIACTLDNEIPNFDEVDIKRKRHQTDSDIERHRAQNLETFHTEIVVRRCLEGIVFKDLATPYGLGSKFRNKGYWFKLKDDYNQSGSAADIDVLVLGASFATGMKKARLLSRFLVGCREDDSDEYMTLCTVSGGGTSAENLERLLRSTGFKVGGTIGEDDIGSWFKAHGNKLPEFISQNSYQRSMNSDNDGWKYRRDHYPDLWINPKDSFVLTINAGEIVSSTDHSAGVSLRFPRISRIRAKGFDDPKSASEVETISEIHERFFQKQSQMQTAERDPASLSSTQPTSAGIACKFLTSEQHYRKVSISKKRKARRNDRVRAPNMLSNSKVESRLFSNYSFNVLEGTYNIEACNDHYTRNEGWLKDAETVSCQQDVIDFILKHGGKCDLVYNSETDFIIGGRIDDARVANHRRAIETATGNTVKAKTKHKQYLKNVAGMGVIKWTFLFQVIHKIFESQENDLFKETATILKPHRYDFLVLSKVAEESFLSQENTEETTGILGLKLALDEVGRVEGEIKQECKIRAKNSSNSTRILISPRLSWQRRGLKDLEEDERWILEGPRQHFWRPCAMVLYPDLFIIGDFGFSNGKDADKNLSEERWNTVPLHCATSEVASVLPLAKAMGAYVTAHLHDGVTHILCELNNSNMLRWNAHAHSEFTDVSRGNAIRSRLLDLDLPKSQSITLVSPTWIRGHWYK